MQEPEYVQAVRREFASVRLPCIHRSPHPLPPPTSPILICVVRNEGDRLADLLRHYREAGIRRFCFIDNGSRDGSVEFLASQPDVDVLSKPGVFEWKLKQGWINRAIADYGLDRWFLYVDADELILFEGFGTRGLPELAAEMEQRGIRRVRGFLMDMYGDGPLLRSSYRPGDRLLDAYPFYDLDGYVESRFLEVMSVKGGPRRRAFSPFDATFNPELAKYPLFRLRPGELMANPHHIWPYHDNFSSPRYLAMLHFKFLPNVMDRIRVALAEKSYWGGSAEYRAYHQAFQHDPELRLHGEGSARFVSAERLVEQGLIARIGWSRPAGAAEAMVGAARRHRAGLAALARFEPRPVAEDARPGEAEPLPPPPAGYVAPPVDGAETRRPEREAMAADGGMTVTVREFRRKAPNYRHIDVTVQALPLPSGGSAKVRFKLGLSGIAPRLEFRPGPDWPLFARAWPGTAEDHYGPVFRVGPGGPRARYMLQIEDAADREALGATIDRLPEIVAAVLPQLSLPVEDIALFSRAARELPAALS